ncbi:MAG: transposase [Alphaproteobacteria bacterium]|nr:transposase [Alphaproteobacteria bacterium]
MVMSGVADFAHLDPAYRRHAALPDHERIEWIQADRWIGFDQAQAALNRLDALLAYPARDRMPCLLIFGDTGMGKTKIVRKFERLHPPTFCQTTGVTRRPVVVAQIPPEPVERDLYRELLASLDAPALAGGTLAREKDVCRSLLRTVEARMIVLDEVNGMLAGTYRQQRVFLNALRFLANDLRAPLVCAGTDLARAALLTDAQLAERFEAFHLARWKNDGAFARLLKSLAAILPLRLVSDLESVEVRARVHALTAGVTARIFRLIETAAEQAILSGKERLDLQSFGDDLILPLVSMTQTAGRRAGRAALRAAG